MVGTMLLSVIGVWWLNGRFGALHPEGRRFESHSICHVVILDKSFIRSFCLYNAMSCPVWLSWVKFDSCNDLLSSVHGLLVNVLQFVKLFIKMKNIIILN